MAENISISDTDGQEESISISMSDIDTTDSSETIIISDRDTSDSGDILTLDDNDYAELESDIASLEDRVTTLEETSARVYTYEQASSSETWDIVHNLNTFPYHITIMDSSGSMFEPVWDFPYIEGTSQRDPNRVIVSFNGATTGTAFLNY